MHLEIGNLHFEGEKMAIDFEFDNDFRSKVARVRGTNYISKKDLQDYVVGAMKQVLTQEDISNLRKELEN
mgnify:FL=1